MLRLFRNPLVLSPVPMPASAPKTSLSTDNFTVIFHAAASEYQRVTGKHLDSHPFATQLDICDSPEAVSRVLRNQVQAFRKISKGDERLMAWLDPTIQILSIFSATLGEAIGLVGGLTDSLWPLSNAWFSVIPSSESSLYRHRYSSRSKSTTESLSCASASSPTPRL